MDRTATKSGAHHQAHAALTTLTGREHEVAVAVAVGQGKTNAEIATELYLNVATVKAHITLILTKLDLSNRAQIALLIHDAGLS
jgi:DNA-binding NarL/FixJ family response regulator